MKPKKRPPKTPEKLPDFTLEDIIRSAKPKTIASPSGPGCNYCGSTKFISKGEVKVTRGQRMKTYHCYDCGHDFYKGV